MTLLRNHTGAITQAQSHRRNHTGAITQAQSHRRNHTGAITQAQSHRRNNLLSKLPLLLSGLILAATLFGCRDQMTAPQEKSTPTLVSNSDMSASSLKKSAKKINISRAELNEAIEETAIALAASLKDVEVRRLIKAEASKKFDGDFDVLFSAISDKRLSNGKSFAQKLGKSRAEKESRSGKATTDDVGTTEIVQRINKVPLFQIRIPYYVADKWDVETQHPLVICLPDGISKRKMKRVKAFDSEGKIRWIDVAEYSKNPFPVVVLSINERVDAVGNLRTDLITMTPEGNSFKVDNPSQLSSSNGSSMQVSSSGQRLVVKQFLISSFLPLDYSVWEPFDGAPELYFWCENRSTGGSSDISTNFWDEGRGWFDWYVNLTSLGGFITPYYSSVPNRTIFTDRSRPINVDVLEYDPGEIFGWDTDPDDWVEHRWFLNGVGSELDHLTFWDQEAWYYGKDRLIIFTARWE